MRNLPAERDVNRVVRAQDRRKHVGCLGGQALFIPSPYLTSGSGLRPFPGLGRSAEGESDAEMDAAVQ